VPLSLRASLQIEALRMISSISVLSVILRSDLRIASLSALRDRPVWGKI
jgi:hypothetical protein